MSSAENIYQNIYLASKESRSLNKKYAQYIENVLFNNLCDLARN